MAADLRQSHDSENPNDAAKTSQHEKGNMPAKLVGKIGTPATCATEKADITVPTADPRRASGTRSPTIARLMPPTIPPKNPAKARANTRVSYVVASAQSRVPIVKPA